jgi:hypothetical protein
MAVTVLRVQIPESSIPQRTQMRLQETLLSRGFFAAAQRSLKSLASDATAYWLEPHAGALTDSYPYEKISGIIFPSLLHHAERWLQMTDSDVAEDRPYLQYFSARLPLSRHSDAHGLVLSSTDSFWLTHYPPNSYFCRCAVHSISWSEIERDNLEVSTKLPKLTPPDDGFDFNVGELLKTLI